MALKAAFRHQLRDADLHKTIALPAAASTSVVTAAVDLGVLTNRAFPPGAKLCLRIPALSTTILPDTKTATLTIQTSPVSNFGSGVETLRTAVLTGAGGVGVAVPSEIRAAPPEDCPRYVRGKVDFGALTTDGSALTAEFDVLAG